MLISMTPYTPALYITQISDNPFQLKGLLLLNQNIELTWNILILSIYFFVIFFVIYLLFLVFYRKLLLEFLEEYEESRELNE